MTVMRILLNSGMDGMTKEVAAAFCGNFWGESSFNPSVKGDSGQSIGIAQWYNTRKRNLENFAKNQKPPKSATDIETQARFVLDELQSKDYSSIWHDLKGMTDINEATRIILDRYEKPEVARNQNNNPGPYKKELSLRISYALRMYQDYQ